MDRLFTLHLWDLDAAPPVPALTRGRGDSLVAGPVWVSSVHRGASTTGPGIEGVHRACRP